MQDGVLRAVKGDGAEMLGAAPSGYVHKINAASFKTAEPSSVDEAKI
jgi:hypothetical protein